MLNAIFFSENMLNIHKLDEEKNNDNNNDCLNHMQHFTFQCFHIMRVNKQ